MGEDIKTTPTIRRGKKSLTIVFVIAHVIPMFSDCIPAGLLIRRELVMKDVIDGLFSGVPKVSVGCRDFR